MATFITIGYGDREGYDRTPQATKDAAHAHDDRQREQGAIIGIAGTPVQVRNHVDAGVETTTGPFLSAELPVAGFSLMEAPDLDAAVQIAAKAPCAVSYGVVEVWPLGC